VPHGDPLLVDALVELTVLPATLEELVALVPAPSPVLAPALPPVPVVAVPPPLPVAAPPAPPPPVVAPALLTPPLNVDVKVDPPPQAASSGTSQASRFMGSL
jgi:hypothetical protein